MHHEIYLPFPPTVNSYYVKTKRGVFISSLGKKFRSNTAEAIHAQLPGVETIDEPVLVEIAFYMPDARTRDVDNYCKALLDSVTKAGLWEDDSLVDQIFIYRGAIKKPAGMTFMRITPAGPVLPVGVTPPED